MRLYGGEFQKKLLIFQPYNVVTAAASLPITLAQVKEHLKLDPDDTSQDTYLTILIQSATTFAEKYTKRTFINTTFETFLSDFCYKIELRRSKAHTISFIKYLKDDVLTTVATSVYYLTDENDFAHILIVNGQSYPTDADINVQAVTIQFVAGYGADATFVPDELKLGLFNHVASMYENRGDCSNATSMFLPALSRAIYDQFRIEDLGDGAMCC